MAVDMRHQLVGFLGDRVQAERLIDAVVIGERHPGITVVHAGAVGMDQAHHPGVVAATKKAGETDQIALDVGMRAGRQVAYPVRATRLTALSKRSSWNVQPGQPYRQCRVSRTKNSDRVRVARGACH